MSITNVLNQRFITDAQTQRQLWMDINQYGPEMGEFNASRATVFVGAPRMLRLSAVLEMKGLQNRKPNE